MVGRYCAINSPLGSRWGQKSLDLRSRDFCPHLEPRGELIAQYRPPMSFRYRNIQKTPPKHVKRLLIFLFLNTVLGSNIRFSAQMSNNAKKTWNNQKTPTKHVLRLFKNFLKIWFSAQKSGSRLRCPTMRKNTLKHPENTNKTCFETFWEFLENPVLGSKVQFSAQISNYAKTH